MLRSSTIIFLQIDFSFRVSVQGPLFTFNTKIKRYRRHWALPNIPYSCVSMVIYYIFRKVIHTRNKFGYKWIEMIDNFLHLRNRLLNGVFMKDIHPTVTYQSREKKVHNSDTNVKLSKADQSIVPLQCVIG